MRPNDRLGHWIDDDELIYSMNVSDTIVVFSHCIPQHLSKILGMLTSNMRHEILVHFRKNFI